MHLPTYLGFLQHAENTLAEGYRIVAAGHAADADVAWTTARFAQQAAAHAQALAPALRRYDPASEPEPERLHATGLSTTRTGPVGLLRDLQDLHQLTALVEATWSMISQAGHGARDRDLIHIAADCTAETSAQLDWLRMRMKAAAPQTLLVAA
jgi:hypothetical protein